MELTHTKLTCGATKETWTLHHLTDIHDGAPDHAQKELDERIEGIKKDPRSIWIGGGDYGDLILPGDKRFSPGVVSEEYRQYMARIPDYYLERLSKRFSPIADKCIGLAAGNHEATIGKNYHRGVAAELAMRLNLPDKYLGDRGWSLLTFEYGQRRLSLSCFAYHGWSAGRLKGRKALQAERDLGAWNADVLLLGHDHQPYSDVWYCVDTETEALTAGGWKHYDELRLDDLILTLNHETGRSEWHPIEAINIFPAMRREMVSIEAGGHSSLTTPDHRWPVERYVQERVASFGEVIEKGYRREFVTSDSLTCWDRLSTAAPVVNLPLVPVYEDAFVELVGWAWTEGSVARSRGKLTTGITIYQSHRANPAKVERIRACLTLLYGPSRDCLRQTSAAAWREYDDGRGVTAFRLNRLAGVQVLEVMRAADKVVSCSFVASLTEPQLRLFVEVSMLADGSRAGGGTVDEITQVVEERLDALHMAAVLLGRRTVRYTTNGRQYGLRIGGSRASLWPTRRTKPQRVAYDGIVWCPTTPTGTWLARRNGTVYFTGNTEEVYSAKGRYRLRQRPRAVINGGSWTYGQKPPSSKEEKLGWRAYDAPGQSWLEGKNFRPQPPCSPVLLIHIDFGNGKEDKKGSNGRPASISLETRMRGDPHVFGGF